MEQLLPIPQCFGIIPTGHAPITIPTSAPSGNSFVYTIPIEGKFSHIVVFLLPGFQLPDQTLAAIYISLPPPPSSQPQTQEPQFQFLGALGPQKQSALFKIPPILLTQIISSQVSQTPSTTPLLTLGISLEPSAYVAIQSEALMQKTNQKTSISDAEYAGSMVLGNVNGNVDRNGGGGGGENRKPDTLQLAQRIISNAFNFLASFSGNLEGGVEVVPLKAFEEWWRKFEGRVRNDPGFLERGGD